jgi:hypothetical protein
LEEKMATRLQVLPARGQSVLGITVEEMAKSQRHQRRPSHPFYIKTRPYSIQPFLLAPVLPGETMKNALLQARVVTDPVKNPLIGWWTEFYLFYVKLRDLTDRDALTANLLTNSGLANTEYAYHLTNNPADPVHYFNGGYNFSQACLDMVVDHYFRDEEEVTDLGEGGAAYIPDGVDAEGLPRAKINLTNAMQSLVFDVDPPTTETEELPGEGMEDLPGHLSTFSTHFAQWKEMIAMKMTDATFEDWLRQFGVKAPGEVKEDLHVPELLRYVRDFTYPANTVDALDGSVSSAASWSIAERADKARFFAEPGFVFGVTVTRPKVYMGNQKGAVAHFLNDAYSFLPALLQNDPYTSLRKFTSAANSGPIHNLASDYWLDLRDLFMHGDQFVNYDPATADLLNVASVPDERTAGSGIPLNRDYAKTADIAAMFVTAATAEFVRMDGRCDLTILTRLTDTTP